MSHGKGRKNCTTISGMSMVMYTQIWFNLSFIVEKQQQLIDKSWKHTLQRQIGEAVHKESIVFRQQKLEARKCLLLFDQFVATRTIYIPLQRRRKLCKLKDFSMLHASLIF